MSVLVVSENNLDPAVEAVVDELRRRGVEVFRCDTAGFSPRMDAAAELTEHEWWPGELVASQRRLPGAGIRSVWFRRPTGLGFDDDLFDPERRHPTWDSELGLGGLLADPHVLWVNQPSREAEASYKPVQLATAARCQLTVPPTLITNQPDAVRRFAAEQGQLVIKPIAYHPVFEEGVKPLYTHALTSDELADLAGVETTVHLFQRAITDKAFEARLTVIGRRIFAAAIHAGSDVGRADWRSDCESLRLSVVEVPLPVEVGVLAFMDSLGLMFGAFDFAVDTAGTWWFFECDSAGQFGFVEEATGLPITAAVADLLENGTR